MGWLLLFPVLFGSAMSRADIPATGGVAAISGHPSLPYGNYPLSAAPIVTDHDFPAGELIKQRAGFWFHVFIRVGEKEGLMHDADSLHLIYFKIDLPQNSGRKANRFLDSLLEAVRRDLRAIADGSETPLSPSRLKLKSLLPAHWDSSDIAAASERLRLQRGLRERYLQGLTRSHRWLPAIDSVFAGRGLPTRLKYLPHVESSFQPSAYSKVGAAGMWQFMKGTARHYGLKSNYLIDERRDPLLSSDAAARLLADAYGNLQSWPLALTGYNHGPAGVARAVRAAGTRDLEAIIKTYERKSFGFASANFYAEFLAASSIALKADSLLPGLDKDEPPLYARILLPKAMDIQDLLKASGLKPVEFESGNLFLRPAVFHSRSKLPKGLAIYLPAQVDTQAFWSALRLEPSSLVLADAGPVQDKVDNRGNENPANQLQAKAEKRPKAAPNPHIVEKAADKEPAIPQPKWVAAPAPGPGSVLKKDAAPAPPPLPAEPVEIPNFELQTMDMEKWVHPYDRFDSSVYHLGYRYENGQLIFESGPEETLGHYAEWTGLNMREIRRATGLRGRSSLTLGKTISLRLGPEQAESLVHSREENYRAVEEDFYGSFHVSAFDTLIISRGVSVWSVAMQRELPFWLIQKHNRDKNLSDLRPRDTVFIPVVEPGIRRWGFTRYADTREQYRAMALWLSNPDSLSGKN